MSIKILILFLFCYLKCYQTFLISSSEDNSFYFYDDGSFKPINEIDMEAEDSYNSNAYVRNTKSEESQLNDKLNLYKNLGQELRKNLNSFTDEQQMKNDAEHNSNLREIQNENSIDTNEREILKKDIQNSKKKVYVSDIESDSDNEKNIANNFGIDALIPIEIDEKPPSLIQRIKDKWDTMFRKPDTNEYVNSREMQKKNLSNIIETNNNLIKPQPKNNSNLVKKDIDDIETRSISEVFSLKHKTDSLTSDEIKVLKNFVQFVKDSRYLFSDESIKSVNHTETTKKHHNKTSDSSHDKKKPEHHRIHHHKNNTSPKLSSAVESVKLNISITGLDDNINKHKLEKESKPPPPPTPAPHKEIASNNKNGCPYNFNNMDVEMELKEEENAKSQIPDCKANIKEVKTKINMSKSKHEDDKRKITESTGNREDNLHKRLQHDTQNEFQQVEDNIGIVEDRPLRQYNELMSPEIGHRLVSEPKTSSKTTNVKLTSSSNTSTNNNKNNNDNNNIPIDREKDLGSNTLNKGIIEQEKQLTEDNVLDDATLEELQKFRELVERRLRAIKNQNRKIIKRQRRNADSFVKKLQN